MLRPLPFLVTSHSTSIPRFLQLWKYLPPQLLFPKSRVLLCLRSGRWSVQNLDAEKGCATANVKPQAEAHKNRRFSKMLTTVAQGRRVCCTCCAEAEVKEVQSVMQRGSFHTDSVRRRGVAGGGSDEAGSSVEHAPMCFFLSNRPHTTLPPVPLVIRMSSCRQRCNIHWHLRLTLMILRMILSFCPLV